MSTVDSMEDLESKNKLFWGPQKERERGQSAVLFENDENIYDQGVVCLSQGKRNSILLRFQQPTEICQLCIDPLTTKNMGFEHTTTKSLISNQTWVAFHKYSTLR